LGGGGGEGGGDGGGFNVADEYGITSDCGMSAISGTGSTMKKRDGTRGGGAGGGEGFHGAASYARCLHENLGEYTPLTMLPQEQDDANMMPLLRIYDIFTYFRHFFCPKKGAGSIVEKLRHAIWKPVAGLLWFLGLIAWQVLLGIGISTVALYLLNEQKDGGVHMDSVEQQSYAHEYQASHRNFGVGREGGREAGRGGMEVEGNDGALVWREGGRKEGGRRGRDGCRSDDVAHSSIFPPSSQSILGFVIGFRVNIGEWERWEGRREGGREGREGGTKLGIAWMSVRVAPGVELQLPTHPAFFPFHPN
jgi:hypothetical protein